MQRFFSRFLAVALLASPLLYAALLHAQRNRDPLTDQESDQIADLRDQPNDRVKLYQKFIQQRVDAIKALGANPSGEDLKAQLRAKYEEFTRICDELQDNLDTFDEAHADIRKSLKDLVPAAAKWADVLNQASPDRSYDFSRKTALDSAQSTSDDAQKIYESQKKYFAEHKDEAGKNGTGPS
jgi:chromosome segregation ATPase